MRGQFTYFMNDISSARKCGEIGKLSPYFPMFMIAMADILTFKKKKPAERHKGKTLCKSGFHKWVVVQEKQFDVKEGKLVTIYRCRRCGSQKVTTT